MKIFQLSVDISDEKPQENVIRVSDTEKKHLQKSERQMEKQKFCFSEIENSCMMCEDKKIERNKKNCI